MIYKFCLLLLFTDYSIKYLDDFQNVSKQDGCEGVYGIAIGANSLLKLNTRQFVSTQRFLVKIRFHMEITDGKVSNPTKSDHDHVKICTRLIFSYCQQSGCSMKCIKHICRYVMDTDLGPFLYHVSAWG